MVFKNETWIEAMKKAVKDLNATKPAAGLPTAVATIRYIRDGICDDIGEKNEEDKALCESVRESLGELIKQLTKKDGDGVVSGFASNASAAAKAAGFKTTSEEIVELAD